MYEINTMFFPFDVMHVLKVFVLLLHSSTANIYERIDSSQHSIIESIATFEVESQLQCTQKCFRLHADMQYDKRECRCVVFDEVIDQNTVKRRWAPHSSFMLMGRIQKLKPKKEPITTVAPTTTPTTTPITTKPTTTKPTTTQPAPIDGGWAEWGGWKDLVDTCPNICIATGKKVRKRTCTNPIPMHGGKNCKGKKSEREICPVDKCQVEVCGNHSPDCKELIETHTCRGIEAMKYCPLRCQDCGNGRCKDIESKTFCSTNIKFCAVRATVSRWCRNTCNHCIPGDKPTTS